MKNLFISICVVIYALSWFIDLRGLGFYEGSALYTRFTYMFTHLGILHLIGNMISLHFLFRGVRKRVDKKLLFAAMVIGAFLATFGSAGNIPTVGASGAVMFLMGCFSMLYARSVDVQLMNVALLVSNLIAYNLGHTNVHVHFFAWLYGILFILIFNAFKHNEKEKI